MVLMARVAGMMGLRVDTVVQWLGWGIWCLGVVNDWSR